MRLMMQLPLLLLGSCTPVIPSTSIVIYTVEAPAPQPQHKSQPVQKKKVRKVTDNAEKCERMELAVIETYKIPDLPDLSNLSPDDDPAVVDALYEHIKLLRGELKRVMADYKCTVSSTL